MVVVDTERGTPKQIESSTRTPGSHGTQLNSDQIVGHIARVVDIVRCISEDIVGLARSVLKIIAKPEPTDTPKGIQAKLAALGTIPWSAGACWARSNSATRAAGIIAIAAAMTSKPMLES
jgi:hypothetical protein